MKCFNGLKFVLSFCLAASSPYIASAGELDEDGAAPVDEKLADEQPENRPQTVIVRQNTKDGTLAVAIDKSGVCKDQQCDVEKVAKLKFKPVKEDRPYQLKDEEFLARNELNTDPGADHESWFFGALFAVAIGAWAISAASRNHHDHVVVAAAPAPAYHPYWAGYYGPYSFRACGYSPCHSDSCGDNNYK